jgi:putative DNA primase/helicase
MNKPENFIDNLNMHGIDYNKFWFKSPSEKQEIAEMVKNFILMKKRDHATECMVEQIKKRAYFYAIRSDVNRELWIYVNGIYVNNGATYVQEFVRSLLDEAYTTHIANVVVDKVCTDSYVDADDFFEEKSKGEVAVENGILNLKNRELLPFTPDKIFFNKLPVEYKPKAKIELLEKFFKDIIGDDKDLPVIQEMFGFMLMKEYKYERCFMIIGNGRNGKGKLGVVIKKFIGSENISNLQPTVLEDSNNFSTSSLHGKLVNLSLDISRDAMRNTSMLKSLSGRDIITCPRKFREPITFVNYAKIIYGANELPFTYDTKDAFWERWILLEFPYTFIPEDRYELEPDKTYFKIRDPDIAEKVTLPEEMSGLLNWALDGLDRLERQGDFSYKLSPKEVMALWIRRSDSFSAYFMDCLELDYDTKITKKELRRTYSDYCKRHKVKPLGDKHIKNVMNIEGVDEGRYKTDNAYFNETYWDGVKFKDKFGRKTEEGFSIYVSTQSKLSDVLKDTPLKKEDRFKVEEEII